MTDAKAVYWLNRLSPEDLGLAYQTVSFQVRDQQTGRPLRLAGWWIPRSGAAGKCAVLLHGYADAKVGVIAWAPLFHELGWNVLAVDQRAQGESEGKYVTAGYWEGHDVDQVLNQLKAERPDQTRQLMLFGVSMGAAVAAATAAMRSDIAAVILESPYADFTQAALAHARCSGLPGPLIVKPALRLAQFLSGARFEQVKPVELIGQIKSPVLVISAGDDPLVETGELSRLEAAVKARGNGCAYWCIDEAFHVECLAARPEEYRQKLQDFLAIAIEAGEGQRQPQR